MSNDIAHELQDAAEFIRTGYNHQWIDDDLLDRAAKELKAFQEATGCETAKEYVEKHKPPHIHTWVDATNEAVKSGEICLECNAVRTTPTTCQAGSDGECGWCGCPQIRDGEPQASGRSCPIYDWNDDER